MLIREYEKHCTMSVNFAIARSFLKSQHCAKSFNFSCNDVLYSQVVAQYLGYTQAFNVFYNLIHWPNGGTPPVNMPRCGFSGELCVTYGKLQIMFTDALFPIFRFS